MDKAIIEHRTYMTRQLSGKLSIAESASLYQYHMDRVRDFQHERLVHLLVTLFFGAFSLASIGLYMTLINTDIALLSGALAFVVSSLEVAYIYHYYKLENGVQSLYKITRQFENSEEIG